MKVMVIEIRNYRLRNILIKLDHTEKNINNFKKYDTWKMQITTLN